MQRISMYYTPTHASITVIGENGVNRETSSNSMVTTLHNMQDEDRTLFLRFCECVVECLLENKCKRLNEF